MMDTCHTCGGEIAGGADHALVLPSPFSSFHVAHHMSCYMATAIAAEREACSKIVHDMQIAFASDACGWALDAIRLRGTP